MDVRVLAYFLAVVEERSVTAAARRLNMTQPPLSTAIVGLEKELGVSLLVRHPRGVEPTRAGHLLAERARMILRLVDETRDEVARVDGGETGQLTLASVRPACWRAVPTLLRQFGEEAPGVDVRLVDAMPGEVLAMVRAGEVNAGVVLSVDASLDDPGESEDLDRIVMGRERLVAVLPAGHPVLGDSRPDAPIDLVVLEHERWAVPRRSEARGLTALVEQAWSTAGIRPTRVESVVTLQTSLALVEGSGFVCMLPESIAEVANARVAVRPITPESLDLAILLLWRRRDRSNALLRRLRNAVLDLPPAG